MRDNGEQRHGAGRQDYSHCDRRATHRSGRHIPSALKIEGETASAARSATPIIAFAAEKFDEMTWSGKITRLDRIEKATMAKSVPSFTVVKGSPEHARAITAGRPVAVVSRKCGTAEEWLKFYRNPEL